MTRDEIHDKLKEIWLYEQEHGKPNVWIPPNDMTPEQISGILRLFGGEIGLKELGIDEDAS